MTYRDDRVLKDLARARRPLAEGQPVSDPRWSGYDPWVMGTYEGTPTTVGRAASNSSYEPTSHRSRKSGNDRRSWLPSLWGLVCLTTGLGLCVDGLAVATATHDNSLGLWFFWPAIVVPFVIYTAMLLGADLSRALRYVTIALIGIYPAVIYRMSSPLVFGGFDEHLHERTLLDLLHGSGLFAPNPLLAVSPDYPGMELFTGVVIRLTGIPYVLGASITVLLCRLLLVMIIYESALTVNPSHRVASLVLIFYAASPQFFFFNSQFAYQSMALPLGLGGIFLLRRAQLVESSKSRRFVALAILALVATVVTHHMTSWFVLAFLIAWAFVTPRGLRNYLVGAAAAMGVAVIAWTAGVATKMIDYMGPIFASALNQFNALLDGTLRRQIFSNQAGLTLPEWQRALLIAYAVTFACGAVFCGLIFLNRGFRDHNGRLVLVGTLDLIYPCTLAVHFLSSAASLGDRASTFFFLPLALSLALVIAKDRRVIPSRHGRPRSEGKIRPTWLVVTATLLGLAYMGGIILGSGADWLLLPGPYMVSAEARTQDPETLAAVQWVAAHLPPGSRVVADRIPADLLASEARQWPVIAPRPGLNVATLYFSGTWTAYQTNVVRQLHIGYIYVDERLSESLPQEGYYIYPGETSHPEPISAKAISKFSHVAGLVAVFHRGPVTIYSTFGLGVKQELGGVTGHHSMGLGRFGDFLVGVAVSALAFAFSRSILFNRSLRWLSDTVKDCGVLGAGIAGMSAVIFLGGFLFAFRIIPGPAFSIGAIATAALLFAVTKRRYWRSIPSRTLGRHWPDPLAVLGVVAGIAGLALCVHAAWGLDVTDVDKILRLTSNGGAP